MRVNPVKYLFIDGAYLRKLCQDYGNSIFGSEIEFNFSRFSSHYKRTFYYDCEPPRRKSESIEDYLIRVDKFRKWINVIRKHQGFHAYVGTTKGQEGKVKQKQVDVKIAVDMLSHSYRKNMDEVYLLAGDLDFKPVVDEVVSSGMYITLIYHPRHVSEELMCSPDN